MRIITKDMYPHKNDLLMQVIFVALVPVFIIDHWLNCTKG